MRQTGFLIPDIGDSSRKGVTLGDAFYWAPKPWVDTTLGAQYLSRRGALERGQVRAKPFEDTTINYSYFGVDDRGLLVNGVRQPQGGEEQRLEVQSKLPGGWRFVTDYNHLSSLTFPVGVRGYFWRSHQLRSAQRVFSEQQFSRLQPEFRRAGQQELLGNQSRGGCHPAQFAGGPIRLGGTGAVAGSANLFWAG